MFQIFLFIILYKILLQICISLPYLYQEVISGYRNSVIWMDTIFSGAASG